MNIWIGLGRLTRDVETKYSETTGKAVVRFTLAIDRYSGAKTQKAADYINCVAFDKVGETIGNFVKKGQRLLVKGSIRTSSYINKAGAKQYTENVIVESFSFIEKNDSNSQQGTTGSASFEKMGTVIPEIDF